MTQTRPQNQGLAHDPLGLSHTRPRSRVLFIFLANTIMDENAKKIKIKILYYNKKRKKKKKAPRPQHHEIETTGNASTSTNRIGRGPACISRPEFERKVYRCRR